MKQAHGWWWPDHEQHMLEWVTKQNDLWEGRLAYQGKKIRRALSLAASNRPAGHTLQTYIDIGGHVGLWAFYMRSRFTQVIAFEPIAEHRACFERNVEGSNVRLMPYGLGDATGEVGFYIAPGSSGGTYVQGKGSVPIRRMDEQLMGDDSLVAHPIDLIKVDCEGYEWFALHGAEPLIRAHKPAVVVEQKPGMAQKYHLPERHAVTFLQDLGMKVVDEMAGDFFLRW